MSDGLDAAEDPTVLDVDLDLDGVPDAKVIDLDNDGTSDAVVEQVGDDTVIVANTDDTPGADTIVKDFGSDGVFEVADHDAEGDGYFEEHETATETIVTDPETGETMSVTTKGVIPGIEPDEAGTPASPEGDPIVFGDPEQAPLVSPASAYPEGVHGDPAEEAQWAEYQSISGYCAPVSVAMVISAVYGVDYSEADVVPFAKSLHLLNFDDTTGLPTGMNIVATEKLIEAYGIPAHTWPPFEADGRHFTVVTETQAEAELDRVLDQGEQVIVAVDSDEIWYGNDDEMPDGYTGPDHALVVTQVDDINGTVTLNDPGNDQGGAGWVMSKEEFMSAWEDGGYQMAETDLVPDLAFGGAILPDEVPIADGDDGMGGLVGQRSALPGGVTVAGVAILAAGLIMVNGEIRRKSTYLAAQAAGGAR